jgi:hypothetical protein
MVRFKEIYIDRAYNFGVQEGGTRLSKDWDLMEGLRYVDGWMVKHKNMWVDRIMLSN